MNESEYEQDFTITLESIGMATVLDTIEKMLIKEYGFITMRRYHNEKIKSTRYWNIVLKHIDIPNEK